MKAHDWQHKKRQRPVQKALLILPWCHSSSRRLLQTKPIQWLHLKKRLAKVQGFCFLVWSASTKSWEAFNVLLLWSLQMLWKCSWWMQVCQRCCLRSCWGSKAVHRLKTRALWRLHQISLSLCFLEVKKGMLQARYIKKWTRRSRHLCWFLLLNRHPTINSFIILAGILLRHDTFHFCSPVLVPNSNLVYITTVLYFGQYRWKNKISRTSHPPLSTPKQSTT